MQLGLDNKTVARYLDLFEKSFVLYNLRPYLRNNLRYAIRKKSKYYFYDVGIRNAILNNFNGLEQRNDTGQLWENYLFMERLKKTTYKDVYGNMFFWRTYDGEEVDLVEERDGKLFGYEFKWGNKKSKPPKLWLSAYKEATHEIINRDNYLEFIS